MKMNSNGFIIQSRNGAYMRAFFILNILFFYLLVGCTIPTDYSKKLVGKWKYTIELLDKDTANIFNGVAEFKPDGTLLHHGNGTFKAGIRRAKFEFKMESIWKVENCYLIEEKVGKTVFFNFDGDRQLIELLKKGNNDDVGRVDRYKIIELSADRGVLVYSSDTYKYELVLDNINRLDGE